MKYTCTVQHGVHVLGSRAAKTRDSVVRADHSSTTTSSVSKIPSHTM